MPMWQVDMGMATIELASVGAHSGPPMDHSVRYTEFYLAYLAINHTP
jgi:hypothetical protein